MSKVTLKQLLSADNPDDVIKELSFENGLKLLEELVESVESGSLPLEQAVSSYERGVEILSKLKDQLSQAEKKLKVLQGSE